MHHVVLRHDDGAILPDICARLCIDNTGGLWVQWESGIGLRTVSNEKHTCRRWARSTTDAKMGPSVTRKRRTKPLGGLATPKRLDVPISAVFTGVAYKNYVLDRYSILSPRIPPLKARESFII